MEQRCVGGALVARLGLQFQSVEQVLAGLVAVRCKRLGVALGRAQEALLVGGGDQHFDFFRRALQCLLQVLRTLLDPGGVQDALHPHLAEVAAILPARNVRLVRMLVALDQLIEKYVSFGDVFGGLLGVRLRQPAQQIR